MPFRFFYDLEISNCEFMGSLPQLLLFEERIEIFSSELIFSGNYLSVSFLWPVWQGLWEIGSHLPLV